MVKKFKVTEVDDVVSRNYVLLFISFISTKNDSLPFHFILYDHNSKYGIEQLGFEEGLQSLG